MLPARHSPRPLLPVGCVPEPQALTRLLAAHRRSPSVGIVGPKHVDASDPGRLRSVGITATRTGRVVEDPPLGEPDQGQYDLRRDVIAGVRPTLVAQNTAVTGASNVTYRFEVAADQAFTRLIAVWSAPRSGGDHTEVTGSDLAPGTEYYWRVNASDGGFTAPYSIVQAFRTEAPPAPPAPTPDPQPQPQPRKPQPPPTRSPQPSARKQACLQTPLSAAA